jgi:hypothetical protein
MHAKHEQALRTNRRLERLNVRVNEIGDEGSAALAAALRDNNTLKEIQVCVPTCLIK